MDPKFLMHGFIFDVGGFDPGLRYVKIRGRWKWEGSLKKPDATRSPNDTDPKKLGSPSASIVRCWFFGELSEVDIRKTPRAVEVPKKSGCH